MISKVNAKTTTLLMFVNKFMLGNNSPVLGGDAPRTKDNKTKLD
jgi:hypothetical protein